MDLINREGIRVRLPTNFRPARFEHEAHTAMLRQLQADIEAIRQEVDGQALELPVKPKVHDSVFVPRAKWAMLLAGNYRCVTAQGMRPIQEAVRSDPAASRAVCDWVSELCVSLGAKAEDLVPFEKCAAATKGLASPSSAAHALFGGVSDIERVGRLVQTIAAQKGLRNAVIDETAQRADAQLQRNRTAKK